MTELKTKPAVKRAHAMMDRDPKKALAMIDEVLAGDAEDPIAHYARGQILAFGLERPKDARASLELAYEAVIENFFFAPDVHQAYAKCLHALGELDKARDVLDGCLSVYPDHVDAWLDRADLSKTEGKLELAIADTREALARSPKYALALYNLACYLALAGKPDDALDALERSIAVTPDDAASARDDDDFRSLRKNARFQKLTR